MYFMEEIFSIVARGEYYCCYKIQQYSFFDGSGNSHVRFAKKKKKINKEIDLTKTTIKVYYDKCKRKVE